MRELLQKIQKQIRDILYRLQKLEYQNRSNIKIEIDNLNT